MNRSKLLVGMSTILSGLGAFHILLSILMVIGSGVYHIREKYDEYAKALDTFWGDGIYIVTFVIAILGIVMLLCGIFGLKFKNLKLCMVLSIILAVIYAYLLYMAISFALILMFTSLLGGTSGPAYIGIFTCVVFALVIASNIIYAVSVYKQIKLNKSAMMNCMPLCYR